MVAAARLHMYASTSWMSSACYSSLMYVACVCGIAESASTSRIGAACFMLSGARMRARLHHELAPLVTACL
jgi:hypothetical protein